MEREGVRGVGKKDLEEGGEGGLITRQSYKLRLMDPDSFSSTPSAWLAALAVS